MKNNRLFFFLFSLLFISLQANAYTERNLLQKEIDLKSLETCLVMNQRWVPYPDYTDRAGWDKFLGESKDLYIKQGEKKLKYEWKVIKATDYLEYLRSGDRNIMQVPYGENNKAISDLVMAELAEGKGRFIDQIINGVFHTCEMTSWSLSAHLSAQQAGGFLPSNKDHVIELTSGEVGSMLSWTYYFLNKEFDKVNPIISERLHTELQKRILDTYMNDDHFWWIAFNWKPGQIVNNWNPWCNFNVLQCFFLLENDKEKLAKAVYRTITSVDKFINYVNFDGACEEGPSYWGHAAGKLYDYLQMLNDGTSGKVSIFNEPIIRNLGEYISRSYVGNNWVVNFADASAKGADFAPIIYRYGKAVNSDEMMHYAAYLNSRVDSAKLKRANISFGTDMFRGLQTILYKKELAAITPYHKTAPYTWYMDTQFCYMNDKSGFFFASKGGFNNESHNHNDVGTFSLYLNTVPVFIDAGVGTYTRQTFSSERYNIWSMQSNYHNLPMINGVPQKFGAEYKALNVSFKPKEKTFSLNIAKAYPAEAEVKRWVRTYVLSKGTLKISDAFDLKSAKQKNQINFMTWGKVDISVSGKILIEVQGEKIVLIYDKNVFNSSIETIKLDDPRFFNVWGKEIYRVSLLAKSVVIKGNYKFEIIKQ